MRVQAESAEHLRETPVSRREIHDGRLIGVVDDEVRLAGGRIAHREVVLHRGAVAVVALDDARRVVLVRQWRHPAGRALWEIPAGTRDRDGESEEETARRELTEETGFTARSWTVLGEGFLAPGYSTELMRFFLAEGLTPGQQRAEDDERLDVGHFTRDELVTLVRSRDVDVKTIAGVALAGWQLGMR
jgi:ADP-ribose pyrophosphatase